MRLKVLNYWIQNNKLALNSIYWVTSSIFQAFSEAFCSADFIE